jgi:butyrate kinase
VDPVSVDEFHPLAYYSGHPDIKRKALSHALSVHAVAYKTASEINKPVEDTKFVVAHLGGGISIAAVKGGKIVDVNDASSDGPFTPERTGGLPLQPFIELCFSGKYSKSEVKKLVMGHGGLKAYLGTSDALKVETKIQSNDEHAIEVYEAMAYQISKEIGAMSAALEGNIDKIILTGGLAKSTMLTDSIIKRVKFIAPVDVSPDENEMLALAKGALRVLNGIEKTKEY